MHTLTAIPISDIVLAAPRHPIQPGLPAVYQPKNWVEEWKKPGKRMGWTDFFQSLPPEYQNKARQDYQEYRSNAATPTPEQEPVVDEPVTEPSVPGATVSEPGAAGGQEQFPFMENPQKFLQRIRSGVVQFSNAFNNQTIRPYNNAIQHALRAIKNLSQQPDISPDVRDRGEQLLQIFQQIQAGDAEDAQLVRQLGELAYQLGQAAGAYQPGAASNMQTRGPQPASQPSFWQKMFPRSRAANTLTAEAGSAARLLQ